MINSVNKNPGWISYISLILFILIGIFFRIHLVSTQVVIDDEMHSIHVLEQASYSDIFKTFGTTDICIPQTLLSKLMYQTIGLNEITLRILPLIFGISFIVVLPFFVYHVFDLDTSILSTIICSISPLFIAYTRYARPYAMCILLITFGTLSFLLYIRNNNKKWLYIYMICGVFSAWFQILSIIAAGSPVVVDLIYHFRDRSRVIKNIKIGLSMLVGMLILLLPPLSSNFGQLTMKMREGSVHLSTAITSTALLAGTEYTWFGIVFLFSCIFLIYTGYKKDRYTILMLISPLVLTVIGIMILNPSMASCPIVFTRYIIWCWPLILIAALWSLHKFIENNRTFSKIKPLIYVVLIFAIFSSSLLIKSFSYPNQLPIPKHMERWVLGNPFKPLDYYKKLSHEKGDFSILEIPFVYFYHLFPYDMYQSVHKKKMFFGNTNVIMRPTYQSEVNLKNPGYAFNAYIDVNDKEKIADRNIKYIILHYYLAKEIGAQEYWENFLREEPTDFTEIKKYLESTYGAPIFQDHNIVVFQTS